MNKVNHRLRIWVISFVILFVTLLPAPRQVQAGDQEKITVEEVIARHLKSIGTPEDLASAKTRIVAGTSLYTARSPGSGQNSGLSILFSEGNKSVIAMTFVNPEYPHEKFGFDGESMAISYIKPGFRSTLGDFIFRRTGIFKEGLVGGTLTTAWLLLNWTKDKGRLEYGGSKKINDRETYVLKYTPRKGSDLKISLYFDAETFRHVRSEYEQVVSAQMSSAPDADKLGQRELHYKLEEQFSDFKQEGKLTLPHTYKIRLMMERNPGATFLADWEMVFSKFSFNQPLEAGWFDVNAAAK